MFWFAVRSSLRVDRLVVHDEQCVPYQFTESAVAELHVVHVHAGTERAGTAVQGMVFLRS